MRCTNRIREELRQQPDEQLSPPDSDARLMRAQAKGTGVVDDNVQAAGDAKQGDDLGSLRRAGER